MTQVCSAVPEAHRAPADIIDRALIFAVAGVFYVQSAPARKQLTVPGITSGHYAVEHVNPVLNCLNDVLRRSYSHQVPRMTGGHQWRNVRYYAEHRLLVLADRQPPNAVPVKSDIKQALEAFLAQVGVNATLVYSEYCLAGIYRRWLISLAGRRG